MDALGGQEVLLPVTFPMQRCQEYSVQGYSNQETPKITDEIEPLITFDSNNETAAIYLVREYGQSYAKYPFLIYQMQTQFRNNIRPWGGLVCTHEFTTANAYSFHSSQEDLEEYYIRCFCAYQRIFSRMGVKLIDVLSMPKTSGVNSSHVFAFPTPVGEERFVLCNNCDYRATLESAESVVINQDDGIKSTIQKVYTPGYKTIEDIRNFLQIPVQHSCKAVVYQINATNEYVVAFMRGDLEANETKLENFLGEKIRPAIITEESGIVAGYIGPCGLTNAKILFDKSLQGVNNLCCGANEEDYHFIGFQIERDFGKTEYHDFSQAKDGGICPQCKNSSLSVSRGIMVGETCQLGDKYTKSTDMSYVDANGNLYFPVMGGYKIGISRLAATICEASHDNYGPIWPVSIAPWQIHLCCVRANDAKAKEYADKLYSQLQSKNLEVLYDDRLVSAGVMFADADLMGVPFRIIISPRNMKDGCCEITTRNKSIQMKVGLNEVVKTIENMVKLALFKCS